MFIESNKNESASKSYPYNDSHIRRVSFIRSLLFSGFIFLVTSFSVLFLLILVRRGELLQTDYLVSLLTSVINAILVKPVK